MIKIQKVIHIHNILIEKFGGYAGVRDKGLLESAIHRPFQTFDGKELYPSSIEKAAAIFESLIKNHPFIDGNKRIAYVLMRLILLQYELDIVESQEEKFEFVIRSAEGHLKFDDIKKWIETRIVSG